MSDNEIEIDRLRDCVPLNSLSDPHFDTLLNENPVKTVTKGQVIFKEGDTDTDSIYLLEGEILLKSKQNKSERTIVAGTEAAIYALAQLRPRQYTGKALTDLRIARLDSMQIDRLLTMDQLSDEAGGLEGLEVDELDVGDTEWMMEMLRGNAFQKVPGNNIHELFARMELVEVKPGDTIIKQGEAGDYYYVVKHGRFNVSRRLPDGKVKILAEIGEGGVFGEEALLTNAPRNANVIAMVPGELMRLSKSDFDELLKEPLLGGVDFRQTEVMLKDGAQMIDVRTPDEFSTGAIKIAKNIPLSLLRSSLRDLDPDVQYIVCCLTGARSQVAAFLMNQRGFTASHLAGGLQSLPKWPGSKAH